jgi:hypothetical protein
MKNSPGRKQQTAVAAPPANSQTLPGRSFSKSALRYRIDVYDCLAEQREALFEAADKLAASLGVPPELKAQFGVSGTNSSCPGLLRRDIIEAMSSSSRKVAPLNRLGDEIRRMVKSVYGDEYDAAPANSCEALTGITYDALLTPPLLGRGEPYRVRCVAPIERHVEHHLSYGRPFPPRYKDMFADRGATAGELGLLGRRYMSTDIVLVELPGARYDLHGLKHYPTPLLMNVDATASAAALRQAATIHRADLVGFLSLGYDTPGYGYSERDADGTPTLQRLIGCLAEELGVVYVSDNAWGMPFVGTDPRLTKADVMLYSMDKVTGSPIGGLAIGREAAMVNIRRALGIHGERWGNVSAHGKASHVAADPGRESMAGMLAALRVLRDSPEKVTKPIDDTHAIVLDELSRQKSVLGTGIVVTKSYNLGGVEINYEGTWANGKVGIPIFNIEDRVAGSNLLSRCLARMGVIPNQAEDGNLVLTPGLGTVDEEGNLIEERMRLAARGLFSALALLAEWVGERS